MAALRAGGCRIAGGEARQQRRRWGSLAQVEDVFAVLRAGRIDYELADLVNCTTRGDNLHGLPGGQARQPEHRPPGTFLFRAAGRL